MKQNYYPTKVIGMGLLLFFTLLNGCKTDFDESANLKESKQTGIANATIYKHPGILNTQNSLTIASNEANAGSAYRVWAYDQVTKFIDDRGALPVDPYPI